MKIALITGATAGFGKACAIKFAANRYDLILTGRRKERLDSLKSVSILEGTHIGENAFYKSGIEM